MDINAINSITNIKEIYSSERGYAALTNDNKVYLWGRLEEEENNILPTQINAPQDLPILQKVAKIYTNYNSFTFLYESGHVFWLGTTNKTNDYIEGPFEKIYTIYERGFVGIKSDNSVVKWGHESDYHKIEYNDVNKIYTNKYESVALLNDNSIEFSNKDNDYDEKTTNYTDRPENLTLTSSNIDLMHSNTLVDQIKANTYNEMPTEMIREPFTSTTSTSSGDPYVTTFSGFKYKLQNIQANYRAIDTIVNNKKLIVNLGVSQLTKKEIELLKATCIKHNITENPHVNGYFYDTFYIQYGDEFIIFDRQINIIKTNIKNMNNINITCNNNKQDFECPIQGKAKYTSYNIKIFNYSIKLMKVEHPQIINSIEVSYNGPKLNNIKGILNSSTNPRKYKIKKITNIAPLSIKNENKIFNKNIVEKWKTYSRNAKSIL